MTHIVHSQIVVYIAWDRVSTVSKTRAWVEKNQMWLLADGKRGDPPSLDSEYNMTSVTDGLLINTHPLKTYRKGRKSKSLHTDIAAIWHTY